MFCWAESLSPDVLVPSLPLTVPFPDKEYETDALAFVSLSGSPVSRTLKRLILCPRSLIAYGSKFRLPLIPTFPNTEVDMEMPTLFMFSESARKFQPVVRFS